MNVLSPVRTKDRKKYSMSHKSKLTTDFKTMSQILEDVEYQSTKGLCVASFGGSANDKIVSTILDEFLSYMQERNTLNGVLFLCDADPGDLSKDMIIKMAGHGISVRNREPNSDADQQIQRLIKDFERFRDDPNMQITKSNNKYELDQ